MTTRLNGDLFKRASNHGAMFAGLAVVGEHRFEPLDQLFCQSLSKPLPPYINHMVWRKADEAWKADTTITGLQVL